MAGACFRRLLWGLEVGGTVPEEAGGAKVLREDDADRDEDSSGTGSKRDSDFDACAFGIFIAAAESDAALRKIFTDGDFLLKATTADTGEHASFHAIAITARQNAIIFVGERGWRGQERNFRLRFDPYRGRITDFADARNTFARFEGFQLEFIEMNDFAALAKTTLHEQASESFFSIARRREFDIPEIAAWLEEMQRVEKAFGLAIDFGDDTGASGLGVIAIEDALEGNFLTGRELFLRANNTAIA